MSYCRPNAKVSVREIAKIKWLMFQNLQKIAKSTLTSNEQMTVIYNYVHLHNPHEQILCKPMKKREKLTEIQRLYNQSITYN